MITASRFITRVYALLVRLYPCSFRVEFEEEMHAVFADAVAEAAEQGGTSLTGVCLRELRDWPKTLLSEYWLSARIWNREATMHKINEGNSTPGCDMNGRGVMPETKRYGNWGIDSQRQALAAALPPLLFGLGIALASLVIGGPFHAVPSWRIIVGVIVGLVPVTVLAGGGLIALVRRLPDWGYAWVGADLMGLLLLLMSLAEDREFLISPVVDVALVVLILLAGLAVLSVAALRGWQQAGLVSIGLSATLGLSLCFVVTACPFHRHDLALLAGPLGLLVAALTYAYTRGSGPARIAVLLGVGLLNVGLTWMAGQVWQTWYLLRGESHWLLLATLLATLTGLLLAGPLLGLFARPLRRIVGRA